MPHFVFANGNEIAAKSADGASVACQPDVCFSPGAPYPGIPVPYPNSVKASDLDNLSRTVFIKSTGAALEDQSFFSTSYGDEPATPGLKKGTITEKIKGKAYFKSWSPNVKFEGLAVARHMDTVTHNHGSPAPNALVQKYRAIWKNDPVCAQDRATIEKNCAPEDDESKKNRMKKSKNKFGLHKLGELAHSLGKKTTGAVGPRTAKNGWIRDHCEFLGIKPSTGAELENFVKDIRDLPNQLAAYLLKPIETLKDSLITFLEKQVAKQAAKIMAKKGAKVLLKKIIGGLSILTGPGAIVVNGLFIAHDIYDSAQGLEQIKNLFPELRSQIETLTTQAKELASEILDIRKLMDRYSGADGAQALAADFMSAMAAVNPCIRARKCQLVPFDKTDFAASQGGDGCCPGQTGHHLIYDSWMKGAGCGKYKKNTAPTVCVEGTNQRNGTHGAIHDLTDGFIKKALGGKLMKLNAQGRMSYADAKKAAIASHKIMAPGCNPLCIEKQLDAYYKEACGGKDPTLQATDKNGRRYTGGGASGGNTI